LKPVVERDHTPDWALLDWATVQQDLGHLDQAIAALKRLQQRDTSNATVHYRLAQLYDRVGNKAEAAREFAIFSRLREK
jgi:predicted Zn-dependent protease